MLRVVLISMLEKCGYTTRKTSNGHGAIQLKKTCRFRLVITDISMPGMDGLEVIMEHTRTSPDMPLLAMTGDSHYANPQDTLKMARILGSHAILEKPFGMPEFLETVYQLITPSGV